MKRYMLATGSLIAFSAAMSLAPALAQTTASGTEPTAAQNSSGLSEIIVTALRREERNQDVPIAITAFSPERLQQQNVKTGQDLNGVVPSLSISSQGQSSREVEGFILRGQVRPIRAPRPWSHI